MDRKAKILLTGGGSGGHIYPLIAISEELYKLAENKELNLDLRYAGYCGQYERLLLDHGIKVYKIPGSKFRRYFSPANLFEGPRLVFGFVRAFFVVATFKPGAVFSKGGPGALPVVWAASALKIPIVIHESDSIPGMTSLMTARFAKKVAVSFVSSEKYFPGKYVLTGNPVREDLFDDADISQEEAKKLLGFNSAMPLIFFFGGSQGAIRLNNFVTDNLIRLTGKWQILHQTGKANYDKIADEEKGKNIRNYRSVPYLDKEMGLAFRAADLVVSRAGSGSIFEIAAFGKPSILIPLPEAAQNHQLKNAEEYAGSGAAIVVEENKLDIDGFISAINDILSIPEREKKMSDAARGFSKPKAASDVVGIIYSIINNKHITTP